MASTISAGTTSGTAIVVSGDTTGNLAFQTQAGANTITVPNVTGIIMVSGNMPAFSAYQTTGTALSAGTTTKVLFDTELFDTNSNFASSTFTPTVAGYYQVNACVFVSGTVSALLTILNASNGASRSGSITNIAGQGQAASTASAVMYFNGSTDYVEVQVFSSDVLTTLTGQYTHFSAAMVRSA
jgi:hypothetical protein